MSTIPLYAKTFTFVGIMWTLSDRAELCREATVTVILLYTWTQNHQHHQPRPRLRTVLECRRRRRRRRRRKDHKTTESTQKNKPTTDNKVFLCCYCCSWFLSQSLQFYGWVLSMTTADPQSSTHCQWPVLKRNKGIKKIKNKERERKERCAAKTW